MYPNLNQLFSDYLGLHLPFSLYSFGVMIALAIFVAAWLCQREFERMYSAGLLGPLARRAVLRPDALVPDAAAGVASGAKGSRTAGDSPSRLIPNMVIIIVLAAIAGGLQPWGPVVAGFQLGPLGTYYGGLLCASAAVSIYVWWKGLSLRRVVDAVAPGLMLAYAAGRIGCYLAGDGDWGPCSSLNDKPRWIPGFLWSETFPRNILGVDVRAYTGQALERKGLSPEVCTLADGVYPTMLYEALLAIALFVLLWRVRRHAFEAGWLFSLYVVLSGLERFLIENLRINPPYLFELTQAQLIALVLLAAGSLGLGLAMLSPPPRPLTEGGES